MGIRLLPEHVGRLLEIGYGSGILMPELNRRCDELFGIDPHPHADDVAARLRSHNIHAQLASGSAEKLPYANGMFDRAIAISSIEFVPDADVACREIIRVLKPDGRLIVVTPGHPQSLISA